VCMNVHIQHGYGLNVCINYGNISSLCTENTIVLTVTSLLRKDIGEIVKMLKTAMNVLIPSRFNCASTVTVRAVTFTQNGMSRLATHCALYLP
jgi:hypothetical protein